MRGLRRAVLGNDHGGGDDNAGSDGLGAENIDCARMIANAATERIGRALEGFGQFIGLGGQVDGVKFTSEREQLLMVARMCFAEQEGGGIHNGQSIIEWALEAFVSTHEVQSTPES